MFRKQYGLVTRRQAVQIGLSDRQIDLRVSDGRWFRDHRGVYRAAVVPSSWENRLLGAVLTSRGLASHRCAAALWGLDRYRQPPVEIAVPWERRVEVPGVVLHRSKQWDLRDESVRRDIPCTGIERTILDCGAVVSMRTLEVLAESAIRQQLTTWGALIETLSDHSARGRDGCGTLRELLKLRFGNRRIPLSTFSRLVAEALVKAGLPRPVLEYRIVDSEGRHVLQVDLAWPHLKKAWELDGLQFHFGREDVERDRRKRNAAIAEGWTIQEILWSMYMDERPQLIAMARKFLAS